MNRFWDNMHQVRSKSQIGKPHNSKNMSGVPYVASFSGLSIFDFTLGIL